MDERFERQLRAGLADLLDPVGGAYPEWTTSPAARRAVEPAPPQAPLTWWPAGWWSVRPATLRLVLAAILVLAVAAAALLWYRPAIFVTGPTHTPSPAPSMTPPPTGTTIVVTSTAMTVDPDDGLCTLPEAITAANDDRPSGAAPVECPAGDGADRIELSAGATYELSSGLPVITSDLTIASSGDGPATVTRRTDAPGFRIFRARGLLPANLTLVNLTISNGQADEGGAIWADGPLSVEHCTFRANRATRAGGVVAVSTNGEVIDSIFEGNHADEFGGAIYAWGQVAVQNSTFTGNTADEGGAVWVVGRADDAGNLIGGVMTATGSTFRGNQATAHGGAIANYGDLTLTNTDFSENGAASFGGAVYNLGDLTATDSTFNKNEGGLGGGVYTAGRITLERSSFWANRAELWGGGTYIRGMAQITDSTVIDNVADQGGGIYNTGSLTMTNSTSSGNVADQGGAFYNTPALTTSTLTLSSDTVADNTAGEGSALWTGPTLTGQVVLRNTIVASQAGSSCAGAITDEGYNLSSDASCGFTAEGSRQNLDPQLGWLGDNGGPTQSYAPLPGSPTIDAIPADDPSGYPAADQRGVARPQDGDGDGIAGADVGAVEVEPRWGAVVLPATLAPGSDVPLRLDPLIGVSHDEAWGVDADGSVWHYARGAWSGAPGPGGFIRDLLRTPDGTLWIATADGAFVLQGTTWVRVDWRPTWGLAVDRTGAVWATPSWTTSWDARAYARDGTTWTERRRTASTDAILEPAHVAVGLDGTVWVGSWGWAYRPGLVRYVDGTWEKVEILGDTPLQVMDLVTAPNGDVWAAGADLQVSPTSAGWTAADLWLARFDGTSWEVYDGAHEPRVAASALDATPDGTIWAATAGGLSRFDGTSWSTLYPATAFGDVSVAPDGTVWATGSTGVGRFVPTSVSE